MVVASTQRSLSLVRNVYQTKIAAAPSLNCRNFSSELKMAVGRIQIASNKKAALQKQSLREVAKMLAEEPPKEEKARIRAEALIRDDNLIEAYEILQLNCELLHERIKLIEYSKDCPHDLVTVVSTIMWASHRVDIPELVLIRKQFKAKYGKEFEDRALKNTGNVLNERVVHKLSVEPPAAALVQIYLERICEQHHVDWSPKMKLTAAQLSEPMAAPVGFSVGMAQGTGLGIVVDDCNSKDYGSEQSPPIVTVPRVVPYIPPSAFSSFAETDPEIHVPPAVNSTSKSTGGSTLTGTSDDEDGDDNEPGFPPSAPPATSPGGVSTTTTMTSSYADLAARFDQLKK